MAFVITVLKRNIYQNDVPIYLLIDGQNITSELEMTENLNELFTTVDGNLASELPSSDVVPLSYLVKIEGKASSFMEISDDITSDNTKLFKESSWL